MKAAGSEAIQSYTGTTESHSWHSAVPGNTSMCSTALGALQNAKKTASYSWLLKIKISLLQISYHRLE